MKSVCFYFQVHQPYRVKRYRVFDIGKDAEYFNDRKEEKRNNRLILERAAHESYIPTTQLILELLNAHPDMRVSYSFSGTVLDQLERYAPEAIDLFRKVINTGQAEVLAETYYHSLAFFYSLTEFERQVTRHRETVRRLFGVWPRVFRNSELAYRNDVGAWADHSGYVGIMTSGWDAVHGWRNPNHVYSAQGSQRTRLLLDNEYLTNEMIGGFHREGITGEELARMIGWRFGEEQGDTVNLFLDYDDLSTQGAGGARIAQFLAYLPREVAQNHELAFHTPSEVIAAHQPKEEVDVPSILTRGSDERDLHSWAGNPMQKAALENIYALEPLALEANDNKLLEDWRRLQASDHFQHMNTKWDSPALAAEAPYETPYDAYISYMNALSDLRLRLQQHV